MSQWYSLKGIVVLVGDGLYGEALTLVRPMFEAFVHLWNICHGSAEQARRFLLLPVVREWRSVREIAGGGKQPISQSLGEAYVEMVKQRYDEAVPHFGATNGHLPGSYTNVTLEKLVDRIDQAEGRSGYCRSMYQRLWAGGGSEIVHRTLYGIGEGLALITDGDRSFIQSNPVAGLEACVYSSAMAYRGGVWICRLGGMAYPSRLKRLYLEVRKGADTWFGPKYQRLEDEGIFARPQ